MIPNDINLNELTIKRRESLRYRCIYLRTAYEVVLQYMNNKTWVQCIEIAIKNLREQGIVMYSNEKSVRTFNTDFRRDERFSFGIEKKASEPLLFSIFPTIKDEFIAYCNKCAKNGELSVESAHDEIINRIVPDYYKKLSSKLNTKFDGLLRDYNSFLKFLQLKNISYVTTWRWLRDLGFLL